MTFRLLLGSCVSAKNDCGSAYHRHIMFPPIANLNLISSFLLTPKCDLVTSSQINHFRDFSFNSENCLPGFCL